MQQSYLSSPASVDAPIHLGVHLRLLRDRHGLSQGVIVMHLPGWQQASYSRIEKGSRAPVFESLPQIWQALKAAGVRLTVQEREVFLLLAQQMLESRKTRHLVAVTSPIMRKGKASLGSITARTGVRNMFAAL